jgi:hypothetical protein
MALKKSFLSEIHLWRGIATPGLAFAPKDSGGMRSLCETVIYPSRAGKGKRASRQGLFILNEGQNEPRNDTKGHEHGRKNFVLFRIISWFAFYSS